MGLSKKPYTISQLDNLWSRESIDVVQYLKKGILKASIELKSTMLVLRYVDEDGKETFGRTKTLKGLFDILNYNNIEWYDRKDYGLCCDIAASNVRLSRYTNVYAIWGRDYEEVGAGYWNRLIRPSDILITAEEVVRFELEHDLTATPLSNSIVQPEPELSQTQSNSSTSLTEDDYLVQHKEDTLGEKAYWLRINTKFTANEIGEKLDISHNTPGCCSRKVTVGKLIKEEALRLGTWEQVKRNKGK